MFFSNLINRKLSSLLRPYLKDEPNLELNLGFLRSNGVINNVHFNTSVLNQLLDHPNRLRFKELTVHKFTVRFTNWFNPALTFHVEGVNVVLAIGEEEDEIEGAGRKKPKVRDTTEEELEFSLAEIDPEGSALHDIIKRISNVTGSSWKSLLYSRTLGRCSLFISGVDVLVQSASADDPSLLILGVKEFSLQPQLSLRGAQRTFGSLHLVHSGKIFFDLDINGFEIGLRSKSHLSSILPPTDFRTCITLYNFQLTDIFISVPSLCFDFSPTDLSVILLFGLLSSRKSHYTRNGVQLWRIAASKMSYLISDPRLSLNRVVSDVFQWMLYLRCYQNVLSLVGYPLGDRMKKSVTMVIQDRTFSDSVKYQLRVISETEKKLPAHAIAQARRIARQEAILRDQELKNIDLQTQPNSLIWKFFHILALVWDVIAGLFFYLSSILLFQSRPKNFNHLDATLEDYLPKLCIILEVGEFSLSTSPSYGVFASPRGEPVSKAGVSYENFASFHFSVDAFFARYSQNLSEKCISFASGSFKFLSKSTVNDSSNSHKYKSGQQKKKSNDMKRVLWTEPAQFICYDESVQGDPASTGEASMTYLESLVGALWSNWKNLHENVGESMRESLENPSIICESKFLLTNQKLKGHSPGIWNCGLVVGKFNIFLEYSSIMSMAVIIGQIQNALSWENNKTYVVSHLGTLVDDLLAVGWNGMFKSYMRRTQMGIVGLLPLEHIQIGALVAGPLIQVSVREEDFDAVNADICLVIQKDHMHCSVQVDEINLLVLPDINALLASPISQNKVIDTQLKDCQLKVHKEVSGRNDISKGEISLGGYLKLNGLKAYTGEPSDVSAYQFLTLDPTTIALSSLRKNSHSFGTTDIDFFAALSFMSSGVAATIFQDELFVLMKVVSGLFYAFRHAFDSVGVMGGQEELKELMKYEEICSTRMELTSLTDTKILCAVHTSFELNSMRIFLPDSYRSFEPERHAKGMNGSTHLKLGSHDIPKCGVNVWIEQLALEASLEEEKAEIFFKLTELHTVIFKSPPEVFEISHQTKFENLVPASSCLSDASLSHFKFALSVATLEETEQNGSLPDFISISTSHGPLINLPVSSTLDTISEIPRTHPTSWLLAHLTLSDVYIVGCQVKDILARGHNSHELEITFSIAGQLQTITCQSQGGSIFLETSAVVILYQIFDSYINWIKYLYSAPLSLEERVDQRGEDMARTNTNNSPYPGELHKINWNLLETFTMDISQFCLALLASDGKAGRLDEVLLEMDAHLDLRLGNVTRKSSLVISKLSILSLSLCNKIEGQNLEIRRPDFSSNISIDSSSSANNDHSATVDHEDMMPWNRSSSTHSILNNEYTSGNLMEYEDKISYSNPQNYILKELSIFLMVEWPVKRDRMDSPYLDDTWVGNGSISGLELTFSLRELQMILFAFESMTNMFSKESPRVPTQRNWTSAQDSEEVICKTIADGTIVAIQDVYQHMYIVVEDTESRYSLGGSLHYSLAGQRALFKVKYHKMRWKSQHQYFSLLSLYAKSDSGEPLRLNCRARSDFLDISGSDDSAWSLWKVSPYEVEAYEGDTEWDSYHPLGKNTFSLVNKKNESCVSFIDGLWELTSKPGNPVKMKVLYNPSPSCLLPSDHDSVLAPGSTLDTEAQLPEERECDKASKLPGFIFSVGKVSLTIVHELSNAPEKFPLLQGFINSTDVIVQILNTKVRVISTLEVLLNYFDARRNTWRELINQLVLSIFYRSRFSLQGGSNNVVCGVPVHLYARVNKLDVSVTELSLDILLFVIGKLNLAGPYALGSSSILGNCCKVENNLGLGLLCQFNNEDNVSVTAQKSLSVFLRQLDTRNQHPEFSVRVMGHPPLSTSPIHLPLVEAEPVAWRTRLLSSQDSKSFPGPFIVVEVSRSHEDGLSVIISPLLKIHNKTKFSMELRFQQPEEKETEFASLNLNAGDSIDDTMVAFGAINLPGGSKSALVSLGIGDFMFSFRPNHTDIMDNKKISSVEWSEDLKGGKPVRLSRVFDKLSYQVRKAFSAEAVKSSLSTANCALKFENEGVGNVYFLIQTIAREVPVVHTDNSGLAPSGSPIALRELKEIFLLPTVHVANMLHTDIHVNLTEKDPQVFAGDDNIGRQATIPSGSSVNLYANPSTLYFVITLTSFGSSCKTVNSSDWVRNLEKQKSTVRYLDIELDFGNGKYFASLRLSRGDRGMLQVAVFTSYTLVNDMDFSLQCFPANQKHMSRVQVEGQGLEAYGDPSFLPPNSTRSWLMKSPKISLKLSEERALEAQLDLDAISGLTEIDLLVEEKPGFNTMMRLGVSVRPPFSKLISSQMIVMKPRYVISNESELMINVRQCYLEGDMEGIIAVDGKQKAILRLQTGMKKKRDGTVLENLLKKHKKAEDDSLLIHFRPEEAGLSWSGPISVSSLGRFFLRFKSSVQSSVNGSTNVNMNRTKSCEFAAVHVVEEDSTIVLHFHSPPNINIPYRIENCLQNSPITFYQKGSDEPEILGSGATIDYVWDDLTLPHKLVVQIDDVHLLREIHLDKLRGWKPLYKSNQTTALGLQISVPKTSGKQRNNFLRSASTEPVKLGYEVYADGLTRVLRISEYSDRRNVDRMIQSSSKMRLKISYFTFQLLEHVKEEVEMEEQSTCAPVIVTRLQNININSTCTGLKKFNKIKVESISVDQKWNGAPFASMLRKHQSESNDTNDNILHIALILLPPSSGVKQVKFLSIVLQPLDLNLDEETLMKMIPFWRTSLSDSPSQQYYFDHFEIHPIKIVASFLPGDSYYSYNTTQETVRSLLHSVIKIPAIKSKVVELNGVLITHALINMKELSLRCGQHYSWYALRAIYIAKGSPLLPPAFASMFDDLASSSLDVFFDPSSGVINLPGLTIGTFKLIKKCIDGNGLSGTKRYFGDLGKTLKSAGSNVVFAAVTEISDSILRGAKTNGVKGMVKGFHQGILQLAMEPSVLGSAFMEGGPDRKIKLDRSPGVEELYIEGYLQAMLDSIYKQEYLRVRVMDNQVILKNLPPNSSLVDEIMERVKGFLVTKALLKGDPSIAAHSLRHIRGGSEWRFGPTVLTLCEHLFVSFAIRFLRKQAGQAMANVKLKRFDTDNKDAVVPASDVKDQKARVVWKWGIGKFFLSAIVAYIDGRLCRSIPNPLARRIVSGFLLSFLDNDEYG